MTTQRTPVPWEIGSKQPGLDVHIEGVELHRKVQGFRSPGELAYVFGPGYETNAEFIVRACGAHDALVAALEAAQDVIGRLYDSLEDQAFAYDPSEISEVRASKDAINAALKLAQATD